jgi:hypothetical protein
MKLLLTFPAIGAAFSFQKAVKNKPFSCKIIPTPRCLAVSCSYSAVVEYQPDIDLAGFLQDNSISYSNMFQIIVNEKGCEVYK